MLQFNVQSSGLLYSEAAGVGSGQPPPAVSCPQRAESRPARWYKLSPLHTTAEVAEGGQSVVEGEAPGQLPVAGVGGSELPAGLDRKSVV